MTYPIFNSVVNRIESDLNKRNISLNSFRTWNEDRINATGLEIEIDLQPQTNFLKGLSINLDWDRFRETVLAKQLDGMQKHPCLQDEDNTSTGIAPIIDIEVSWLFDEKAPHPQMAAQNGNHSLNAASEWMEEITQQVNELLADDDIITRWHLEVEGSNDHKYLSAVNLISYFQYSLIDLKSLNEVHNFVIDRLEELLGKSKRVITIADQTLESQAA
ncbi:hypothetical protein LX73_0219 [Fodinibius salinus]|uniref:Uncharacterized protein n=1 Tax=Fodinibius salinus TaxID=860790 RepID=A0A5D3YLA1_9BACT|nr:hypothetical protein [Fodinibius salinus]TYP94925.1 hypothetical protein LX73_0219 [Fodinibius salinus]